MRREARAVPNGWWRCPKRQALDVAAELGRRPSEILQEPFIFALTFLAKRSVRVSFIVALAISETLEALAPGLQTELKWPNDVLVKRRKISGILLELVDVGDRPVIIIGIGLNIVSRPDKMPFPATRLLDHADITPPMPAVIAETIDERLSALLNMFEKHGFAPIRKAWLERAVGLGEDIVVRLPNEELTGMFEGLDEKGALILRNDDGNRIISAGDVFFS